MWTEITLDKAPEEFQQHISEYISKHEDAGLLQVLELRDKNNEIYKYSCYFLWGNMCMIVSMWYGKVLHGHFNEDSMIIGEMKEFMKHPRLKGWFE